jgi:hypothetical protein
MLLVAGAAGCRPAGPLVATIAIDPSIRHQTFRGWEVVVQNTILDYRADLPGFDDVFRQAAEDLGITRLRFAVASGTEHPPGYGAQYLAGELPERTLFDRYAYDVINDNADSNLADPAKFDFTLLDWQIREIVVPYKRHVEAAGQQLYLTLSYVDFGKSAFKHADHPDEYAEFMLVLFDHLSATFGIVPDAINVINEPDQSRWSGAMIGRAIAATAPRLAAAGYHPVFETPSTVDRGRAVSYFDDVVAVPGAAAHVRTLTYHCYRDSGRNSLLAIARRAVEAGVDTAQNECWTSGNDQRALHNDLTLGRNSSWQQGTFNAPNGYYVVDRAAGTASLRPRTRLLRQYYRFIKPGAARVEARTTDPRLDPVAFMNADGRYVIVVLAEAAGTASIARLPPGTYGVSYSTTTAFDVVLPEARIAGGQNLTVSIPAAGVLTIYGR